MSLKIDIKIKKGEEIAYDNIWKIINEPSIDREGNNKKSFT